MLTNFLINTFIKNKDDITNEKVRNAYGSFAGIIGILSNLLLFIIKASVGFFSGSISIIADAFNNLSDAASSIITIIGFKMSIKPADAEHPFGHGRIEYISALIVAFMVMLVGLQFIKASFERILNPNEVIFEILPFILLLISIFIKLWLSMFNKKIGNLINSKALKATAVDAMGDVYSSLTVVLSFLLSNFMSFPIDGYIGVIVSCLILYSGYSLVKETLNPILGEAPDPKLVKAICNGVMSYENIIGVHDLIIHNYGPGRCMASIHAEIPSDMNIMDIHEIIDTAERDISEKLKLYLVIHMDPICVTDCEVKKSREEVEEILKFNSAIKSLHDFRVVGEGEKKNLIFDIVINPSELTPDFKESDIKQHIIKSIQDIHPHYNCIITVDYDFS